jgi:protein-L-isoaspartate(D-aspartate) O-methyltransferase
MTQKPELLRAFSTVPRERFLGPGPWSAFTRAGYVETPSDDVRLVYQDIPIALKKDQQINNGQPSLHAVSLAALGVTAGEHVVHVGCGAGYYTAILAELAGPEGSVTAFEVDPDLAEAAEANLADYDKVVVHARSGTKAGIPECDALYVNAGASAPAMAWLDALRLGGRLLFPLTGQGGAGFMLLVTRRQVGFTAQFVCSASFIPCSGARDDAEAAALTSAFQRGGIAAVRSLRRDGTPDETCWHAGSGWWLSTAEATVPSA